MVLQGAGYVWPDSVGPVNAGRRQQQFPISGHAPDIDPLYYKSAAPVRKIDK
jgi:hypothetical protein